MFQILPMFAVPMAEVQHPDCAALNDQLRTIILAREAQEDFNKTFGRDFMVAYQTQLRRLKGGV